MYHRANSSQCSWNITFPKRVGVPRVFFVSRGGGGFKKQNTEKYNDQQGNGVRSADWPQRGPALALIQQSPHDNQKMLCGCMYISLLKTHWSKQRRALHKNPKNTNAVSYLQIDADQGEFTICVRRYKTCAELSTCISNKRIRATA